MTLEKRGRNEQAKWEEALTQTLTKHSRVLPRSAVEFVNARLANRWIDPDVQANLLLSKTRYCSVVAATSFALSMVLLSSLWFGWLPVRTPFLTPITFLVLLSLTTIALLSCARVSSNRRQLKMWQHLVDAEVALQTLDLANHSIEAKAYLSTVMNLYSWFRFGDYIVAQQIAAAESKEKYVKANKHDHESALWRLFEVESA